MENTYLKSQSSSFFGSCRRWFAAYWRASLVVIALAVFFALVEIHVEQLWLVPLTLVAGYYFGKLTCGMHVKTKGLWLTLAVFVAFNFLHSLIDGIGLIGLDPSYRVGAILGHEAVRQPLLYVIFWAMITPFDVREVWKKILFVVIAVSGVWLLGLYVGQWGGEELEHFEYMHDVLGYAIFLFVGDIAHHVIDDIKKTRKKKVS